MSERVSNTDIRLRIRLCENSLGRGDPHHMALLDLLDARKRIEDLEETAGLAHCPYCHRNVCGDRCTDHDDECPARAAAKGGEDE